MSALVVTVLLILAVAGVLAAALHHQPRQETTMAGPAERYVRGYTLARQARAEQGWTLMEQALVMTLIDWKCDSEMRPSSGEGSDCSDLMDIALGRLIGLARGRLTPEQVLDAIEKAQR
jgi:hypothetical protein